MFLGVPHLAVPTLSFSDFLSGMELDADVSLPTSLLTFSSLTTQWSVDSISVRYGVNSSTSELEVKVLSATNWGIYTFHRGRHTYIPQSFWRTNVRPDATEEVWIDRDNVTEFVIVSDGVPVTGLTAISSVLFSIDEVIIDSATWGNDVVWWSESVTGKTLCDGSTYSGDVVRARLGRVTGIDAGEYDECKLIVKSDSSPNGLVVSDNITFIFYDSDG